jgi:peptide/nickel transport system substrate-binding protein
MELVVIEKPSAASVYLNLQAPVFQDVRVRQALAWGTNREEMITLARGGFGKPACSWFAINPAYPEAVNMGYTKYDPERANQLLDEAGWLMGDHGVRQKDGRTFDVRLLSYGSNKPASELLQSYWKQLGVRVEVQHSPDYGIAQSKRSEGAWEAVIESWGTFPTHQSLWRHFAPNGDINYGPVHDATINTILDQLAVTIDQNVHNDLVYQANQWIVDTVPIIPLYSTVALKAKSKRVENVLSHFSFSRYEVTQETDLRE